MTMSTKKIVNPKNIKRQNIFQFVILLVIVMMINVIGNYFFTRVDLTTEKRYTLSENTKELIRNLDDIVYFRIYLEGDLPAQYKRLRNETRIMLNEFRSYGKNNIQFEFVDITSGKDKNATYSIVEELQFKGIQPIIDYEGSGTEMSQKIIIPGAIVSYREKEVPIQLLVTSLGPGSANKEAIINNSIQALEFKLADAIRKLTITHKPRVALLDGQGELLPVQTAEAERLLSEYYVVERVQINGQLKALEGYKAIIVAKPDSMFSDKDKFIIDQFIMKGGSALWLVDAVYAEMDSLRTSDKLVSFSKRLNLEDMLFKWGVRINTDLLMDINSAPIPVVTGMVGDQPEYEYFSWVYFPLILSNQVHPIVKNLNAIKLEFASSIDTVGGKGIKKTVLLTTSRYTRKNNTPVTIDLNELYNLPEKKLYNKQYIPVAVLLEGEFESVFYNRIPPEIAEDPEINYQSRSVPTKMIVVSDGDIFKNQYTFNDGRYMTYPLGYDRYTQTTYGNADFILNAMSYLVDKNNLLEIRSRELKIRLLDKTRIQDEKLKWQFINLLLPVFFVGFIGLVLTIIRKRIFTVKIK
jgi:ABC-2 type transport system permease protein